MLLTAQSPTTNSYPVEVSGWDGAQSFFVEKSQLEWDQRSGKCVALSHALSPGATIFLHLLQPTSADRSLPVAYHAQLLGVTTDGQHRFRLMKIQLNSDLRD
jgi:hypothetical protein